MKLVKSHTGTSEIKGKRNIVQASRTLLWHPNKNLKKERGIKNLKIAGS
jgi:hypothetical protein